MICSLLSALLRRAPRSARVTPIAAPRFVPTVQSLEVREVPAVLAVFAPVEPVPAAPVDAADTASLQVELENVLISSYSVSASSEGAADTDAASKVTFQDFSFTAKMSKASPKLFL